MTEFQLITDVGTAVATAASDADDIQILVNGEIPETYSGLRTDTAKECVDGVVALSPEYNTYVVAPTAGGTISFDAGDIPGCRFKLMLDCTAGAVSFSLADNFKWTGATPALTDKGLYGLDVVYVSVNSISAFLGTYLGVISKSIDPNKGVIVYRDGVISEDECGEEFNNLLIYNSEDAGDGCVAPIAMVVDINPGSIINGYLELGTDDPATLTVNVKGGEVGVIALSTNSNNVTLNVSGGNVDTVRTNSDYGEMFDLNVTGGTIGLVEYGMASFGDQVITVSGGIVSQLRASLLVEINGGFIGECNLMSNAGDTGELVMTGGTIATLYAAGYTNHTISGGEVQYITDYFVDSASSPARLQLSGCTIGTITHDFYRVGVGDGFGLVPEIGSNVVIDRLDYINFDGNDATSEMAITLAVGANSEVGLSLATQRAISAGVLTINADSTATIINLED